jgi:hypothetical protein
VGEFLRELSRDITKKLVVAQGIPGIRTHGMTKSQKNRFDCAKAAVEPVSESGRLVESSLFRIGPLVEPMLARNHSDQEHEWSHGGKHERHEARSQTEGSRASGE